MDPFTENSREYWEQLYQQQPLEATPWYSAGLDPDFERGLQSWGIETGSVLDIGTGPATQAIALARKGFLVTATDISGIAIAHAQEIAQQQGVAIDLRQDDILATRLKQSFDVILDRGVFHNLVPESRICYVDTLYRLLKPAGVLLLKCFSSRETEGTKPYRFTAEEIEVYVFQAALQGVVHL